MLKKSSITRLLKKKQIWKAKKISHYMRSCFVDNNLKLLIYVYIYIYISNFDLYIFYVSLQIHDRNSITIYLLNSCSKQSSIFLITGETKRQDSLRKMDIRLSINKLLEMNCFRLITHEVQNFLG